MATDFHLVQSLIKSLAILELLPESLDGMGVTEIGERLGLNKSTVHRILSTLVHEGYVEQDQAKGRYRLRPKLFELARKILNNMRPAKAVTPQLEKLAKATSESARYVILDATTSRLIVADEVMTSKPIRASSQLGESLSLADSAAGKMYLSGLSESQLKDIMDEQGRKTILKGDKGSFATLRKDLNVIREKGFAYETQKSDNEQICHVASPVWNEEGDVIAIVDLFAPAFRWPKDRAGKYGEMVKDAALEISRRLGFIPG